MASAANSTIAPCAKVEYAGRLEDQHKAQRHQRIQHADHQAAQEGLKEKIPCQCPVPQVGLDHFGVVAHFLWRAVPDLLAVVQHHHAVADVHHHAHVVLDQHHGGAELVVHVQHKAAHVLLFFHVHACHGLVQQQQLRLHGQRPAQVHALLQAVGQLAHRCLAIGLDLQEVDDVFDEFAVADFFALGRADAQRLHEDAALDLEVAPCHQVVQHAHALEQGQVLEGARHAHHGHLVAVHVLEGLAAKRDGALLRLVHAVDAVEHGALSCAVGPDDGAYLMLAHVKADVRQRFHAAEGQGDVLDVQDDVADFFGHIRRPP
jgi:hypothetical protein